MNAVGRWLWYLLPGNPMVVRVVQGGSQRPRHLWVRMGYLGALIVMVIMGLLSGGGLGEQMSLSDLAKAGAQVFGIISYGQVVLVCLLAPLFMAGAIAHEQSGQTYNILLTTPLTNLQIVLGSLMGRLFFVLALLASGLPLFSVLLIFGGVPIRSVFAAFMVAGLTALLVGSVAVTLSVFRAGGRKAVFVFVIAVATWLVASYAMDRVVLRQSPIVPNGTTWLTPLHPLLVLESWTNQSGYRPPTAEELVEYAAPVRFYLSQPLAAFATICTGVSTVLIVLCSVLLRAIGTADVRMQIAVRKWLRLHGEGERTRPAREVWHNPIAWREANTRGNAAGAILARWGFLVLALGLAAALLGMYHFDRLPTTLRVTGMASDPAAHFRALLHILLLVELAVIVLVALYMSAGSVSREREDGTLDLMLTTPITPRYYIWGKLRGLVSFLALLLAAPVLTVAMVALYSLIGGWLGWDKAVVDYSYTPIYGSKQIVQHGPLVFIEAPILMILMLVPFIALAVAVGMNWSIKSRGVLGAVVPSVAVVGCIVLVTGMCGSPAAQNVTGIGPIINAFSPATNLFMLTNPWHNVAGFIEEPIIGRFVLLVAALMVAGVYSTVVYGMISNMVRGFDHTVRKLSGTN